MKKQLTIINKRNKLLIYTIVASFMLSIPYPNPSAKSTEIANPQLRMVGARYIALGVSNAAILGDINGILVNPATIGDGASFPLAYSNQKVLSFFDYSTFHIATPFDVSFEFENNKYNQTVFAAIGKGSNSLEKIPNTTLIDDRIRQVGAYNSGFDIYHASLGTQAFNVFGINSLSMGFNTKFMSQYIADKSRSAFGIDAGLIASYYMDTPLIDSIHFGTSLLNIFSTPLSWDDKPDEAYLPLDILVGSQIEMLNQELSIFINNGIGSINLSAEYQPLYNFFFRVGTDGSRHSIGTGIQIDKVAGFSGENYGCRLDYTNSLNTTGSNIDPDHVLSVTISGEARPVTPKILNPKEDLLLNSRSIYLKGVGPRSTSIRIYNNDSLYRTIRTNKYGHWSFPNFPLKEGANNLLAKAYSIENDLSYSSKPREIIADTYPPQISPIILADDKELIFIIQSNEDIQIPTGKFNKTPLEFQSKNESLKVWESKIQLPPELKKYAPTPQEMSVILFNGTDLAGNKTLTSEIPFFLSLDIPNDKHIHFKENVRFIGMASNLINRLYINDSPVYIDNSNQFSFTLKLTPGKNITKITAETLNKTKQQFATRILYLKDYKDLIKGVKGIREIQFLATIGLLDGDEDGNFRPNTPVTRAYLTKTIVKALELELPEEIDVFFTDIDSDNPDLIYIAAAINAGIVYPFPDGSFRPNTPLSLNQIMELMVSAEIMGEVELEEGDKIYTRTELAQFLAYSPEFESQIEDLINWDFGYYDQLDDYEESE